jgi:hypothetical protein
VSSQTISNFKRTQTATISKSTVQVLFKQSHKSLTSLTSASFQTSLL